jgi:hypothetical protein
MKHGIKANGSTIGVILSTVYNTFKSNSAWRAGMEVKSTSNSTKHVHLHYDIINIL